MLPYLFTALALLAPNQAEFRTEQVSIMVDIQSNIFQYNVTNLSSSPIVYFEVNHHAAYNFQAPSGWYEEDSSDLFKAWTDDSELAIGPSKTAEFSMRVSSRGAILNKAPAKIRFQSGQTITVPNVWSSSQEPQSYIFLIAGLILFIILLHTIALVRKDRQQTPKAH
jgi:hypothetical protein